jgi:hypothetical protein
VSREYAKNVRRIHAKRRDNPHTYGFKPVVKNRTKRSKSYIPNPKDDRSPVLIAASAKSKKQVTLPKLKFMEGD